MLHGGCQAECYKFEAELETHRENHEEAALASDSAPVGAVRVVSREFVSAPS